MHPFVFYKFDKASHRYDYPSSVTLGIPCYEILAGRGVQELPCKSDRRGNLLAGQGLLRLGQASVTEESYALQLQIVHLLLEGPPQMLRGGCADGLTSGCAVGAVPLDDGHHENDHRPDQERCVTDQGVRHITHLRVRSQWREEREVPLKRPVEPSAEEIIPGREAGQPTRRPWHCQAH